MLAFFLANKPGLIVAALANNIFSIQCMRNGNKNKIL